MDSMTKNVLIRDEIPTHAGEAIGSNDDFFIAAPPEIGALISAHSTLDENEEPMSGVKRLIITLVVIAVGLGIAYGIVSFFNVRKGGTWFYVWMIGIPFITGFISWAGTSFDGIVTYVGEKGRTRVTLTKSRENPPEVETLVFEDADALKTEITNHYKNGSYKNTTYNYHWEDTAGKVLFTIEGDYEGEHSGPEDRSDTYYFAQAAKEAWNIHKLGALLGLIEAGQVIDFATPSVTLSIGDNQLYISSSSGKLDWSLDDIETISISKGYLSLVSTKFHESNFFAKWLGNGKLTLPYSEIPNGELLLLLIEHFTHKTIQH